MLKIIFLALDGQRHPGRHRDGRRVAGLHPGHAATCRRSSSSTGWSSGIDSFPLLAVPFFILAGNLMNNAGITNRIYNFALALVGWMKGGLGHVNVVGSVIFAGMSGTAIADAAGLGTIEIKAMKDHGYTTEFAVGVTAASATLGPIIPPSLPFVIYGMMANVSVGALFLAGILPGLLMAVLMMLTVAYFAHKNNWGARRQVLGRALRQGDARAGGRGRAGRCCVWLRGRRLGAPAQLAVVRRRWSLLFVADRIFRFEARAADHDAGAADRRHDDRPLHAHRRRDRRLRLGAGPRPRLVPHADVEDVRQGLPRHGRDDRARCCSSSPPRRSSAGCSPPPASPTTIAAWVLAFTKEAVGVPAAGQPADAVRRLLPRADRGDHDPGADPAADRARSSASTRCTSAW